MTGSAFRAGRCIDGKKFFSLGRESEGGKGSGIRPDGRLADLWFFLFFPLFQKAPEVAKSMQDEGLMGGGGMTGSALQAMDVLSYMIVSFKEKGRGSGGREGLAMERDRRLADL